jgi:hypothetical protein
VSEIFSEASEYRWDWQTLSLYRVADPALYAKRLEVFWTFFEHFYKGVAGLLKVQPFADANLFSLCDGRIGVAAFNSCHGNDCFAYHGLIPREVIARSHLDLEDVGMPFDLRVAVWHHSIEGPPYRTDYMDVEIVRGMIGRGFRLGLYGHQHKTQIAPHQVWLPDQERMAVISAGSLCAGRRELPTGVHRQYNILEIAPDFRSVRIHVRAMSVANLFSRGRLPDFGDRSFADLDWNPPVNQLGLAIDAEAARTRAVVERAEKMAKAGDPQLTIQLLRGIELTPESYQRQLFLVAANEARDWRAIVELTDPPDTIEELIARVEALSELGDHEEASIALDSNAGRLNLPGSVAAELRGRIRAKEAIKR